MTYDFIDVTQQPPEERLPAEAMCFAGAFLEHEIPGYRTLYVRGREAYPIEISDFKTDAMTGRRMRRKRIDARTLTVGYQLIAEDAGAFRLAYNRMLALLNMEEAQVVFNDEPDKFFVGTVSSLGEVPAGTNAVRGEFEIFCPDPLKYSLEEKTAAADEDGVITFNYNGTCPAYPILQASFEDENESDEELTGAGECGYVSFIDADGHVIQLGNPDEVNGVDLAGSQTLLNWTFNKWDASCTSRWKMNAGKLSSDNWTQAGTMKTISIGSKNPLTVNTYGGSGTWHGPSITMVMPADDAGETGAANFRAAWNLLMCRDNTNQNGIFQAQVVNVEGSTRKIVAGISIHTAAPGHKAELICYVNGRTVIDKQYFDISKFNKYFGFEKTVNGKTTWPVRTCAIEKKGQSVTFDIAGILKKTFTDDTISELKAHELTFYMGRYGNSNVMYRECLYWARFTKDNCSTYKDIENIFSSGDEVTVDCGSADIKLNGLDARSLGSVTNDYEAFLIRPGNNIFKTAYSDWAAKPGFKLRYREAWL